MRKISVVLTIIIMAVTLCSAARAESWPSFKAATFSGIGINPVLATGVTEYTITLDPGATISFGGRSYQVKWIGGFYVNSMFPTDSFSAAEAGSRNDWRWRQSPTHGRVFRSVGWKCSGNADRLRANPGGTKTFYFSHFDLGTTDVTPGFHIGYGYRDCRGDTRTGYFSGPAVTRVTTPEPSGLQAGIAFLSLTTVLAGRRVRRTVRK